MAEPLCNGEGEIHYNPGWPDPQTEQWAPCPGCRNCAPCKRCEGRGIEGAELVCCEQWRPDDGGLPVCCNAPVEEAVTCIACGGTGLDTPETMEVED